MLFMMIDSKKNVPRAYLRSRDYQGLLKLLDLITGVQKSGIDNIVNLLDPDICPNRYLPLLASYVGYEYDYSLAYETNRLIIKNYPLLIRLRGSEDGIKLAVALSMNTEENMSRITSSDELFNVNYVQEENRIDIYIYYPNYLSKIADLIEVVRPVGIGYRLINSNAVRGNDKIGVMDILSYKTETYSGSNRYKVTTDTESNRHEIGFGEVASPNDPPSDIEESE